MFTGIIQQLGDVASVQANDFGVLMRIDPCGWAHRPALGDSIAVNGCCLTVADDVTPASRRVPAAGSSGLMQPADSSEISPRGRGGSPRDFLCFDLIQQTLAVTTLGGVKPGDSVNLEHAVTPSTLLGGHIVQGHVDGVGTVVNIVADTSQHRLRISAPPDLMPCIVEKGSIAVDGVSLTVAAAGPDWFEAALIPTTLRLTTLGLLRVGSRANLETDYLAKTVVNYLRRVRE